VLVTAERKEIVSVSRHRSKTIL